MNLRGTILISPHRLAVLLSGIAVSLLVGLSWFSESDPASFAERPLSSEVYVWQRQRSDALDSSLRRLVEEPFVSAVHVLAAEAHWRDNRLQLQSFAEQNIPQSLKRGAVLRLGSSMAHCTWSDATFARLSDCVAGLADKFDEVQIDYDCPQRRLMDYAALLRKLRPQTKGKRLCITALPCWLNETAFKELASLTDDYVLQVHSLHLPDRADQPVSLIDRDEARSAALQASKVGFPFRIALPTYGCAVYFDTSGAVTEVISEDLSEAPASSSNAQLGYSDPAVIAPLVAEWLQAPPAHLNGLIWFRLPTVNDTRNWSFETLARVAQGEPVIEHLETRYVERTPGTFDVIIKNEGQTDAHLPASVALDRDVAFADGTGGYAWQARGTFHLTKHDWPWLRPKQSTTIGWFRAAAAQAVSPQAWNR